MIKLNKNQLRQLVSEAITIRQPGSSLFEESMDPDTESAQQVVSALVDVLDQGSVDNLIDDALDLSLGDETFYPSRIEDVEAMADAVAAQAAQALANDPGFQSWLSARIAGVFRRSF